MTTHRSFGRQILCALVLALTVPSVVMSQEENGNPRPFVEEFLDIDADVRMAQRVSFLEEIDAASRRWIEEYEGVKTPADIAARQKRQRDYFLSALGSMWERTPLNAQITGRGEKEKFRYENILFESVPGFYVTGVLFLPKADRFPGPYPALLITEGHAEEGKEYDPYQGLGVLAAVNGLAAFVMDPIDQGERFQYLNEKGKPTATTVAAHNLVQAGSILVGRNTATFEIWDGMRAIDYLESRDDIVGTKIGVCGTSGGGTQSAYLLALDDRLAMGAPSCYICGFFGNLTHELGVQDGEQNIWGQIQAGIDHADYLMMRAPTPALLCACSDDFFNSDDTWVSYRYALRLYSRMGAQNRLSIVESDSGHAYTEESRVATIRWALRWLAGRDVETLERDATRLTKDEIRSLKDRSSVIYLPGAKTARELNVELADQQAEARRAKWTGIQASDAARLVSERVGIRSGEEAPRAVYYGGRTQEGERESAFETDRGIWLTTRENFDFKALTSSNAEFDSLTLVVSDIGRKSPFVNELFSRSKDERIVAVELRGYGDTQNICAEYYRHEHFGPDGVDACYAYLLGKNYVGLRTDDLLAMIRYYRERFGVKTIRLVAEGYAGTVALVAAVAQPDAISSLKLVGELPTWRELLDREYGPIPLTNAIHGVLNDFDIDDLKSYLSEQGVLVED